LINNEKTNNNHGSCLIDIRGLQTIRTKRKSKKAEEMELISPIDYTTFKVDDSVEMYRVSFKNQYKMEVVGHLFIPKTFDQNQKHPAIIVGHPMGAVKEQSADVICFQYG
jgi:cephalosporin-C deacetylase-like acetyl esterase